MASKHAPGDWAVTSGIDDEIQIWSPSTGRKVASMPWTEQGAEGREPEDRANARLIAAAPDGLEVVKLWLACYRLREQVWPSPEGRREARELLDAHGAENWPDMLAIVSHMSKEFIAKAEGR